ncbi:MAG: corrinoid protein [Clostridia bacterium]|jgi:methylmalonyl-CoA mutase cobalamin-binding domain/chain|nr:corrinoid protein [Clostridia bacterium]
MSNVSSLAQALAELNENLVYDLVNDGLNKNIPPIKIIAELNEGMAMIGELFSRNEYFISELMFSGEIMKNAIEKIEPLLANSKSEQDGIGKIIIGTVKGDIHDIGKNIVVTMLKGTGFQVIDLGVDVPAEFFVEKAIETQAKVVALSALLSNVFPEMKRVVDAFTEAGLRDKVQIIIGGAPCNEDVKVFTGADFYAKDAGEGVKVCKEIIAM